MGISLYKRHLSSEATEPPHHKPCNLKDCEECKEEVQEEVQKKDSSKFSFFQKQQKET